MVSIDRIAGPRQYSKIKIVIGKEMSCIRNIGNRETRCFWSN